MRIVPGRPFRVLDFDIENRPLSYWYDGNPTAEITAIGWCFYDSPFDPQVMLLGIDEPRAILEAFVAAYDQADMVTGHYIRKHDLPIINAGLVELGLPILSSKLTQDTKLDLVKYSDIPKTQEHLGEMLGLPSPKVGMSQTKWRDANRLTPSGIEATKKRVVGDVKQHMEIRMELLNRGLLGAPKVWRP